MNANPKTQSVEWVIEPRVGGFLSRFREVWAYRRLIRFFAARALEKLYRRTVLGRAWIVIRPLFPLLVKTLIFGGVLGVGSDGVPYFLFLVVGTAVWELFAGALMWGTRSIELNRGLITRIYVPRLIIPLAGMTPAFVGLVLHLLVGVVAFLYYFLSSGAWYLEGFPSVLWALLGFSLAALLAFGIALFTAVLGARARDVRFTLAYVLDFWLFLTPVLYPVSAVPAEWRWLIYLNPMTPIVELVKTGLLGLGSVHLPSIATSVATVIVVLLFGLWFFSRAEAEAVDRI